MDDKSAIAAGEGEAVFVDASLLLFLDIIAVYFEAPEDSPAESLVLFTAQDINQATNQ